MYAASARRQGRLRRRESKTVITVESATVIDRREEPSWSTAPPSSPEGPAASASPSSARSARRGLARRDRRPRRGRPARCRRRPRRRDRDPRRHHRSAAHRAELVAAAGADRPRRQQRRRPRAVAPARRSPTTRSTRWRRCSTSTSSRRSALVQAALAHLAPSGVHRRTSRRTRRSRRTRAGAATARRRPRSTTSAGSSPSSGRTSACCRSTPATCARRCTRTRSRARTSPTGRRPSRACRRSSTLIDDDVPSGRYRAADVDAFVAVTAGERGHRRADVDLDHFVLPPELEATEPPELTLGRRDAVRMMVSIGDETPRPSTARDLSTWLREGDLVVVNTSATIPAAIDATTPDGHAGRRPPVDRAADRAAPRRGAPHDRPTASTAPDPGDHAGESLAVAGGGTVRILGRMPGSVRLWVATLDLPAPLLEHLVPVRPPDPLRLRAGLVADHGVHQLVRPGARLGRDAVGRTGADGGRDHRPRRQRHRRRADRAAHRRRLVGGPRDAVPGALPRAGRDGPPRERHPCRRRSRRGGRHHRRAGARDRRRRRRRRPSRSAGGPSSSSRRRAACGSSTACSPAGTSPRPATCRCSRPSPGDARLELAYGAALAAGYRWHEFGDVHLILPERQ